MIVIYTQDETFIKDNADDAKNILLSLYGDKLGREAYKALYRAPVGKSYRNNGGPLVKVVDNKDADIIREKETAIGMM